MKITEADILKGYFPENLDSENFHYYIPRKMILNFVQTNQKLFWGRFVDLGCGFMPYRRIIEGSVDEYIGIDVESSDIYTADNVIFWDGATIPLEAASVDVLLTSELLEHVEHPHQIADEANRVLKPGGTWLGTVPFIWPMHEVPHDRNRYTSFSLSDIIQGSGFLIDDLSALGGLNVALAQMLGLWLEGQPKTKRWNDRMKKKIIISWMDKLIHSDNRQLDIFANNAMFSGLSWVAHKGSETNS